MLNIPFLLLQNVFETIKGNYRLPPKTALRENVETQWWEFIKIYIGHKPRCSLHWANKRGEILIRPRHFAILPSIHRLHASLYVPLPSLTVEFSEGRNNG